ncbi:hypothetical protein CFC21_034395 [Triticum aestivum]|uniref:Uncharacterized protein n=2 Tax=Triticum aestivum TaxID=4565 RepID=A0A9R1F3K1_WHEAT|nr:hypothetical protein CFC21_034395 [Triticum aestivum]
MAAPLYDFTIGQNVRVPSYVSKEKASTSTKAADLDETSSYRCCCSLLLVLQPLVARMEVFRAGRASNGSGSSTMLSIARAEDAFAGAMVPVGVLVKMLRP